MPFIAGRGGTIDRIAVNVTTLAASGVMRCGIYDSTSDTNLYPNALILDSGELSTASTGVKSATVSQALTAGKLYWFVTLTGTAAPTLRALAATDLHSIFNLDNTLGTAPGRYLQVALAYGALPSTFTASASVTTGTVPAVFVRYSA